MSEEPKNCGLTAAQWRQLYEEGNWKAAFVQASQEVSACVHADPRDRETATGLFNALMRRGILSETDWPGERRLAQVIRDVQIAMLLGPPLTVDQQKRDQCRDRVMAMRIVAEMVCGMYESANAPDLGAALQAILGGTIEPKAGDN